MRSQISLFITIIVLAIIIFVSVVVFLLPALKMFEIESPIFIKLFSPVRKYYFDINDIIVNKYDTSIDNDFNDNFMTTKNSLFCNKLKVCIKESIENDGKPCEVLNIKSGINDPRYTFGDGGGAAANIIELCRSEDIIEKTMDFERKICFYNENMPIAGNFEARVVDNEDVSSGNPFYSYEPYIHGCYFDNIKNFVSENSGNEISMYIYAPPTYGNYIPFTSQGVSGAELFPYVETGATTKVYIANATPANDDLRTCDFNIFVCIQPAVTSKETDTAIKIFETFRSFPKEDLGCCVQSDSNYLNKFPSKFYEFTFKENEPRPNYYQVSAAMDAAFWEWNKMNFDNGNLIKSVIVDEIVDDIGVFKDIERIRFSYQPWSIGTESQSCSLVDCTHPAFIYYGNWASYNKLTIKVYTKFNLDPNNNKHLVIIPIVYASVG